MSKNKSNKKQEATPPPTEKVTEQSGEFGQSEAAKLAASYLPDDGTIPKGFETMYITSDESAFVSSNEGAAHKHARRNDLKVFKVENKNGK